MKAIDAPTFSVKDAIEACEASFTSRNSKRELMQNSLKLFEAAETNYLAHSKPMQLFKIVGSQLVGPITKNVMKDIYKNTFAKNRKPRIIYDAIKLKPVHGICPICGHGTIDSLDHFLSQDTHTEFIICPSNLIPSCSPCNKVKSTHVAKTEIDQTLHPYFDNINFKFLAADLNESKPITFDFYVACDADQDEIIEARVKSHFRLFKLNTLYKSQSSNLYASSKGYLTRRFENGGSDALREYLNQKAESVMAHNINAWQAATYTAMAKSDWFCAGNFI